MKSTEQIHRTMNGLNHLMKWPLLCGLLSLTLTGPVRAADVLYQNDGIITYPGTEVFPPVIDATNFVNNGTFIINFTAIPSSFYEDFYTTSDTLNYTNTGVMMGNTGFKFNNLSSASGWDLPAANFYNSGTISAGSTNNVNDPYEGILGLLGYFPQCFVNATNIVNPGTVVAGVDGRIQFAGQNLDLSYSTFNVEGAAANAFGSGVFGLNTNFWDPSFELGPNFAESAFFPIQPFYLFLTNSTAFIDLPTVVTSNNVIRAVFIQDTSDTNVTYNVYFDTAGVGLGQGNVTVEWVGGYQDAATGNAYSNYLYLNDDYVLGASTNVFLVNGIPDNFTFTESPTRLPLGVPANAGFLNVFPEGSITNGYAFANIQLISTTFTTNQLQNLAITNLPGRIEIWASNTLNLAAAQITGPNYLSVQSPNQFDGSPGALIQSPYADLNVGVTNGFLTISNLLAPSIPNWSGNVQAWSTRWLTVDNGVTNDYRVLIVGSQLNPTTPAQVQDLILHGTNSITISDSLNILRKFTADAQNLVVTTNGAGNGATSLAGGLNVESSSIFWASSLPNLRNLTNNGAIGFQNLAQFIANSNIVTVTPEIPSAAAWGKLSELKSGNVVKGDKVNLGTNQYVFVSKITNAIPSQVLIGGNLDASLNNLIAAINHAAGAGTNYSTNTPANPLVTAGALVTTGNFTNHAFIVTARINGTAGNIIRSDTTSASLTWNGQDTLSGGVDYVAGATNITGTVSLPYDNFVNRGLFADQGSIIWTKNFESSGIISNGTGSFNLTALAATSTNDTIVASGDISITAGSLVASNVVWQAGRSVTLNITNLLTDSGVTNGSVWTVQSTNGTGGNGLILPLKPVAGDLLGTTITNYAAAPNRQVINIWAGEDRGVSASGFTNNAAIGRLVLDALGGTSVFKFSGTGAGSNALYVDDLEFSDFLTNGINNSFDFTQNLSISPGMMIYFAQAKAGGISIAAKIDAASKAGKNGGRLRWVPGYVGYFSSTNIVYPDGSTNTVNAGLAGSTTADSDGDGIPNVSDSSPFFVSSQVGLNITTTNAPAQTMLIKWCSVPGSTNYVYYKTNLASSVWLTLTNFVSPSVVPPVGGWPITNVVKDVVNPAQTRFYNVEVIPNSTLLYGQ